MEKKVGKRGRQPLPGTNEAKTFVEDGGFDALLHTAKISQEARSRIKKCVYSGLNIKNIK